MSGQKEQHDFVDFTAPLPLGYVQARAKAIELREANNSTFTWATIADVIRIYHGFDRSPGWWRNNLRGCVVARPRGESFPRSKVA